MLAKRFFYVCAGLLCLALAYHLGASSAAAQYQGPVEVEIVGVSPTAFNLAEPLDVNVTNYALDVNVTNDPLDVSCTDCN